MRFREQMEQLIQCKVSGICARDGLVTEHLKKGDQSFDDLLRTKELDDKLIGELMKEFNSERK